MPRTSKALIGNVSWGSDKRADVGHARGLHAVTTSRVVRGPPLEFDPIRRICGLDPVGQPAEFGGCVPVLGLDDRHEVPALGARRRH